MAFSIVDIAGSGGQQNFSFSFPYLNPLHIHVYIAGVETFAFTFNSTFVVHLTLPLVGAATVRIQRTTPITAPLIDFVNGSTLGEADLDTATLQILYVIQEVSDVFTTKLGLDSTGLVWDAMGKRIINGAVATATTDFVVKSQLDAAVIGGPGSHNIGAHLDSVSTSLAKGDILIVKDQGAGVLKYDKLAAGVNGTVLASDSVNTSGLSWILQGNSGAVGGTADAITLTPTPVRSSYAADQAFFFVASGANTGAVTVNVSALGVKAVTKNGTTPLVAGDIAAGSIVSLRYDGTQFQLLSQSGLTLPAGGSLGSPVSGSLGSAVTAVTQALDDSTTKIATTAFVQQEELDAATAKYPRVPVRQTVLSGSVDVNGAANWIVAGTGLQVDYNATTTPVVVTQANGFDGTGEVDAVTRLAANATNQFGAFPANVTSFLQADKASASSITGANTRIPPQYGETYDPTQAAILHFDGTNGATSTTDDYGNSWTLAANAQLSTAQKQFGTASLLLDGTGDYAEWVPTLPARFAQQGYGWTMECWVRFAVLPLTTTHMTILNAGQTATTFGVLLSLFNNAGVTKLELSLSSNGTAADITSLTVGTNTTWAINTWYHIALVFDPIQGKYYLYRDGAQDISVTSALTVAQVLKLRLGEQNDAAGVQHNGWIDEFRVSPCVRYPAGTTFTPPVSAFTIEGHFFSIPEMKMYEVTSASATAGVNPGLTNRSTRIFLGEADAGAATITAARSYAYRGRYVSPDTAIPAVATKTNFQANLGVIPLVPPISMLRCYSTDISNAAGQIQPWSSLSSGSFTSQNGGFITSRTVLTIMTGATSAAVAVDRTAGTVFAVASASWKMFLTAQRGW